MISTVVSLVQGSPEVDFLFIHEMPDRTVEIDTRMLREVLGDDVPLSDPEVLMWIRGSMTEQYGGGE